MKKSFFTALIIGLMSSSAILAEDLPLGTFKNGEADGWRLNLGKEFPGAQGTFAIVEDKGSSSGFASYLEGSFEQGGNYISIDTNLAKPVSFKSMKFKIKTSDIAQIRIRLFDAKGQIHQQNINIPDNPDWQVIEIKSYKGNGYTYFGGTKDGKWNDPLRAVSILIEKSGMKDRAKSGKMYLADIILAE